jgi:hypothetical protein
MLEEGVRNLVRGKRAWLRWIDTYRFICAGALRADSEQIFVPPAPESPNQRWLRRGAAEQTNNKQTSRCIPN